MGQHKHNPTAQLAKEGKLPPKKQRRMSKREQEALLTAYIYEKTGMGPIMQMLDVNQHLKGKII